MEEVNHYLVTRLALTGWEVNEGWLDRRLRIFQQFTLPSVKAQTSLPTKWLVLCNPNHPSLNAELRGKIDDLSSELIEIMWEDWSGKPVWTRKGGGWTVNLSAALKDKLEGDWVLTTRLDSDDLIHKTFLQQVQEAATEQDEYLSFDKGWILKNNRLATRDYVNNPFLSRASCTGTAYDVAHTRAAPLRVIDTELRAWIQLDHGENLRNSIRRGKPSDVDAGVVLEGFGL